MPVMGLEGITSRMPKKYHLQSCSVDNHRTRGIVTLFDCIDNDYIFDAREPKGEGTGHADRPCSDYEDFCVRREGHLSEAVDGEIAIV
jgi:hypothetical protein